MFKWNIQWSIERQTFVRYISYSKWYDIKRCFIAFASEFVILKVKVNQEGMKLNRTQKLLVYAADDNLLGKDNNIKKNT
jgi:hypothetical protein